MSIAIWIIVVSIFIVIALLAVLIFSPQQIENIHIPLPAIKSNEGKLISCGAGLLEMQGGFDGPVLFFRNDNPDGMNFYLDLIIASWHPHENPNSLTVVSMIYDSSEPTEFIFEPEPIIMNQNFPNASKDNGAFSIAWRGGNAVGMTGSIGGKRTIVFTLEDDFRMIPMEGRFIIKAGGTQRLDVKTESAGALRLAVVGWFAHSI